MDLSVILSTIFIKCSLCRTLLQIGYGHRVVCKLCKRGSGHPGRPQISFRYQILCLLVVLWGQGVPLPAPTLVLLPERLEACGKATL